MPWRTYTRSRRSRRSRRPYGAYRPRIGYSRLNINSKKTFAQNQSCVCLYFKDAGSIEASRVTSYINRRFGVADLVNIDAFNQACYLYEQYKVLKIILTLIPTGNYTSQQTGSCSRGSLATYADTPPLDPAAPNAMVDIINNSSCRMHLSEDKIIKRYVNRPSKQYPQWTLVPRAGGVPNPDIDNWVTTLNVYGDNFRCSNTNYSNIFYWYKLTFKVILKCRVNQ